MSQFKLRYLGDPVLVTVCQPVKSLSDIPEGLLEVMREECYGGKTARGIGIAANQVGGLVRATYVQVRGQPELMINPEIVQRSLEIDTSIEGCLSIPGFTNNIKRNREVLVNYKNENFEDKSIGLNFLESYCIQHEIDHLDGILIVNGASRQVRKQAIKSVTKYLKKNK